MAKRITQCASKVFVFLLVFAISSLTNAGLKTYDNKTISQVLISNDSFGSCMAKIDISISNCSNKWVSFGCSGEFNDTTVAWRMYDQAQMAYSLGHTVRLDIENTEKYNGYCVVKRIDVYQPSP